MLASLLCVSVTPCSSTLKQRLQAKTDEEWEPKRIERPAGVPDWGVPPTEPPERK